MRTAWLLTAGVLAVLLSSCATKPPKIQWTQTTPSQNSFWVVCVKQTMDKGFIAAANNITGVCLLKLDSMGNRQWMKAYGSRRTNDWAFAVEQTIDGGYVLAGHGGDTEQVMIMRTDSLGIQQWRFSAYPCADARDIRQTRDGGFIAGGRWVRWDSVYLLKLDSLGKIEWSRMYLGCPDIDTWVSPVGCDWPPSPLPIRQTRDGGYLMARTVLQKVDSTGKPVWTRDYDRTMYFMNSVEQTHDGGYIATGVGPVGGILGNFTRRQARRRFGSILLNNWVVLKVDSLGTPEWKRVFTPPLASFRLSWLEYGVQSSGMCIIQTMDGGYAVGGSVYDGRWNAGRLIKVDPRGNVIWTLTFPDWDKVDYCRQTVDGGYIIGDGDKHIMKLAPDRTR
jgi:hypothetical protein